MIVYIYEPAADTFVAVPDMPADILLQIRTAIEALQAIETGELTLPCLALPSHCPAMLYPSIVLSRPALLMPCPDVPFHCSILPCSATALPCPALPCPALPSSLSCLLLALPIDLGLLCFVPVSHAASHILMPYLRSGLQSPALPLSCPALHCPCLVGHLFELKV